MLPKDVMEVLKLGGKWWRERKPPGGRSRRLSIPSGPDSGESLAVAMRSSMEELAFVDVKRRLN